MTWIYEVTTLIFRRDGKKQFKARYAGAGEFKNNSKYECLKNQGPLPRGKYKISGPESGHRAGPYVLRLTPYASNKICGRSGFLIHGDNKDGTASKGCIVLHIDFRREIIKSGDFELVVE